MQHNNQISYTKEQAEQQIYKLLASFEFKEADNLYEEIMNNFGYYHSSENNHKLLETNIIYEYEKSKKIYIGKFFKKFFPNQKNFDEEQLLAISSTHKNTLVSARAGSGKTKVIGGKISYLIKGEDINPNEILTLTFNKKASEEIQNRVINTESGFGISNYHFAKTFHAIAFKIVNPDEEMLIDVVKYPDPKTGEEIEYNSKKHKLFIQDCFIRIFHDKLEDIMKNYFPRDLQNIKQTGLVLSDEEYFNKRIENRYYAFTGDYVRSIGERFLLDFLLEYGFKNIKYESKLDIGDNGLINIKKPDIKFNLDGINKDIYLEHWGSDINWKNNVPDFWDMSKEDYDLNKLNKQKYFYSKEKEGKLYFIETDIQDIQYNHPDGGREYFYNKIKTIIENKFSVNLQKLERDSLIKKIKDNSKDIIPFVKNIQQYIQRAQYQSKNPEDMDHIILNKSIEKDEEMYLTICNLVYKEYESRKRELNKIDFNELLEKACIIIKEKSGDIDISFKINNGFKIMNLNNLKYILIDEYQDFSPLFYKILETIRVYNKDYRLFVVGDDWQAINSFAGSDIKYFLEFKKMFFNKESVDKKIISTNYRSTKTLVNKANHLMENIGGVPARHFENNPNGIEPVFIDIDKVNCITSYDQIIDKILGIKNQENENEIRRKKVFVKIIEAINNNSNKSLIIISRQNKIYGLSITIWIKFLKKYFTDVIKSKEQDKNIRDQRFLKMNKYFETQFDFLTSHRSKGKQADIIILLDASEKNYPTIENSLRKDSKYFRIFGDDIKNILENEQKLFYVTLTRAKEEFYILSEFKNLSGYVNKIL